MMRPGIVFGTKRAQGAPQGLPLGRRRRGSARCGNGFARRFVCGLVAVAAVLSPWQSGLLPEPLDRFGADPASAQQAAVIDGTPTACAPYPDSTNPDGLPWTEATGADGQPSLCRVTGHPPCPPSPLAADDFMSLRAGQVDLCEAVAVAGGEDDHLVDDCLRTDADGNVTVDADGNHDPPGVRGYVNIFDDDGNCRLLHPAACAGGLYRLGEDECAGYRRRMWACPATHPLPLNRFNRCYRTESGADMSAGHPACVGAPSLVAVRCEDYVGQDFLVSPDPGACDGFDDAYNAVYRVGTPRDAFTALTANARWCSYPVRHLHVKCSGGTNPADPDCDPQRTAACIMRASGIGGCDGIARTMLCRSLQADYAGARDRLAEARARHLPDSPEVTSAGAAVSSAQHRLSENRCSPCVALPFDSASTCDPGRLRSGNAPRPVPRGDSVDFRVFGGPSKDCHERSSTIQYRLSCEYSQHDTSAVFAAFTRQSYTDFTGPLLRRQRIDAQGDIRGEWVPACIDWQQRLLDDMARGDPPQSAMPEECRKYLCTSPTVGEVAWSSEHASGLAVVHTPIAVTIDEVPLGVREIRFIDRRFFGTAFLRSGSNVAWPQLVPGSVRLPAFSSTRLLTFGPAPARGPVTVQGIDDSVYEGPYECSLRGPGAHWDKQPGNWGPEDWVNPEFSLVLTELSPDEDADEIRRLFGEHALEWWDDPGFDRDAYMSAQGYRLLDGLPEAEAQAERNRRAADRVEVLPCQHLVADRSNSLTCHWMPPRPGYYAVEAAGIWKLQLHRIGHALPLDEPERDELSILLSDDEYADGACASSPRPDTPLARDRDCLIRAVEWMFDWDPSGFTQDEVDLVHETLTQLIGLTPSFDALLPGDDAPIAGPPPRRCLALLDFRYTCADYAHKAGSNRYPAVRGGGYKAASYTTSEPVGILVHGVRVATRRPGGP